MAMHPKLRRIALGILIEHYKSVAIEDFEDLTMDGEYEGQWYHIRVSPERKGDWVDIQDDEKGF